MRRALLSSLAAGLAAILCCVLSLDADAADAIRVATIPIDSGSAVFYAKEMGFFAKVGLDVQISPITSGPAIASAVAGGAADIGYSNLMSLAIAHGKGLPFVVVAPAGLYTSSAPTTLLMVSKSSAIRSAKDLDGKTVATNGLRNIGEYAPALWIDKNGGHSSTVKFVEMPFTEMAKALDAHRIDAAIIAEPSLTEAERQGLVRELGDAYGAVANRFMIGGWFTTSRWVTEHPDVLRRFVAAIREADAWANKNPSMSAPIFAKYAKLDPEVAKRMTRSHFAETLTPGLIQPMIELAVKYKALGGTFPAEEMMAKVER
jgi:NitT/TauT family transport system substrate-binding protein